MKQILQGGLINYRKERALAESFTRKLSIRTPSISTNVMKLSGGNQQKVVLSRWLTLRPKVLLLDEPTRGIDVGAKVDIYRLMTELAKQGVAIVLVTSEMPELIAMSDRLVVLSNGKIQKEFAGGHVTQEEIMAAITSN
jgi:ABC-type sugar transport system ATPase subunit